METNCKKQIGSIVAKILKKNEISALKDKKLSFQADSKYIKFLKFNATHQKALSLRKFA